MTTMTPAQACKLLNRNVVLVMPRWREYCEGKIVEVPTGQTIRVEYLNNNGQPDLAVFGRYDIDEWHLLD